MNEKKHAYLSPSSAERWMCCSASPKEEEGIPDIPSPFSEAGTLAHKLAELALTEQCSVEEAYTKHQELFAGSEFVQDIEEHIARISVYVNYVISLAPDFDEMYVEHTVDVSNIVPGCFGTPDLFMYNSAEKRCDIFDFKSGTIVVPVRNNSQLRIYAIGIMTSILRDVETFHFHIVQPRVRDNAFVWEISRTELEEFIYELQHAAYNVYHSPTYEPSDDVCRYCKARPTCPGLQSLMRKTLNQQPDAWTLSEKLQVFNNKKNLNALTDHIEQELLEEIRQGTSIPGYTIGQSRTLSSWDKGAEDALTDLLGERAYQKPKPRLITITAARRLLSADTVDKLVCRPQGQDILIAEDNPSERLGSAHQIERGKNSGACDC